MFVSKPKLRPLTKCLAFKACSHVIKPQLSLKVLGSYISHDLSNDRELSQLIPILNNRINEFEKLKQHTDFHTRLQFSNSYVIGRLIYMMPTYTNLNCSQRNRIHKILMRTARMTLNSYCFKNSIDFILGSCNWVDVDEMIKMSTLKFINNMLITQTPGTLYSKLKINKRTCSNISFKYFPKLAGFRCTVLYRGISYYNQLPTHFKLLQRHKFKEKLKNERYLLKQLLD